MSKQGFLSSIENRANIQVNNALTTMPHRIIGQINELAKMLRIFRTGQNGLWYCSHGR